MNKVFIDTNVILDLLLAREPFASDVVDIISLSEAGDFRLEVSSNTIVNVNYIVGNLENAKKAKEKTVKILALVDVLNVGPGTIDIAIRSKFKDFEDAVQNFCAMENDHTIIITRNTKDFKHSELAIMTPKEFLTRINS